MKWDDISVDAFNMWLTDPVTEAFIERLKERHYAALIKQSQHVASGDHTLAQVEVGHLAGLDATLGDLQAKAESQIQSFYPEAEDDAAGTEDEFRDPALIPSGESQWTKTR